MRLLLIHENDPACDGCEFAHFLTTAPPDLVGDVSSIDDLGSVSSRPHCKQVDGGLFMDLAIAYHPPPHRQVSLALAAKSLGCEARRRGVRLAAARVSTSVRSSLRRSSRTSSGTGPRRGSASRRPDSFGAATPLQVSVSVLGPASGRSSSGPSLNRLVSLKEPEPSPPRGAAHALKSFWGRLARVRLPRSVAAPPPLQASEPPSAVAQASVAARTPRTARGSSGLFSV